MGKISARRLTATPSGVVVAAEMERRESHFKGWMIRLDARQRSRNSQG